MTQSIPTEETVDPLAASAERGRTAWHRLGLRLRSITPSQIVRFSLGAGVLAALVWLAWTARIALLPFVLGAGLAYIMLPIVNILDRFFPRWFASLLTMGSVTAVILYTLTLELMGREFLGGGSRYPFIDEAWERLLPRLGRHLAAEPRKTAAAVTNAVYQLSTEPGARPRRWIDLLRKLGPECGDRDQLMDTGFTAAWISGMAHFRKRALEILERLPGPIVRGLVEYPSKASRGNSSSMPTSIAGSGSTTWSASPSASDKRTCSVAMARAATCSFSQITVTRRFALRAWR